MILIVNDMVDVAAPFKSVLDWSGTPCEIVETVAGARDAALRIPFTGFILDIHLADGTGMELLEWLRTQPDYTKTPVAIVTADMLLDEIMITRIQRAGAQISTGVFDRPAIETLCLNLLLARPAEAI